MKCKKQVNLLMIVDDENRHYTTITSISRLLKYISLLHELPQRFSDRVDDDWPGAGRQCHVTKWSSD